MSGRSPAVVLPALPAYAEEVLAVVDRIPPGQVLSYGDIAECVGTGGPRQVGAVMAAYGGSVPWWRVLRSDGSPPRCHEGGALSRLAAEGCPLRPGGERVDMVRARWEAVAGVDAQGDTGDHGNYRGIGPKKFP